jgi:hypothetical protein
MPDPILPDSAGLPFATSGGLKRAFTKGTRVSVPWRAAPARWPSRRSLFALFAFGVLCACGDRRIVFCDAENADIVTGGCGAAGGSGGASAGGTGGAGGGGNSGSGGSGGVNPGGTGGGGSAGSPVEVGGGGGSAPLDASVASEDAGLDAGDAASP